MTDLSQYDEEVVPKIYCKLCQLPTGKGYMVGAICKKCKKNLDTYLETLEPKKITTLDYL